MPTNLRVHRNGNGHQNGAHVVTEMEVRALIHRAVDPLLKALELQAQEIQRAAAVHGFAIELMDLPGDIKGLRILPGADDEEISIDG